MGEGGPTFAARSLPQYISAFATRVLQSTYVWGKGQRALSLNFQTFKDPRLQFHKKLIPSTFYGGYKPSWNRVVVQASQAIKAGVIDVLE
jgi:hypothetical protein